MATITFDTLRFAKRLQTAGVPVGEAEAISEAFKEVQGEMDLATKQDLRDLEQRMVIKVGGMLVVAVGLIAAVVKLL